MIWLNVDGFLVCNTISTLTIHKIEEQHIFLRVNTSQNCMFIIRKRSLGKAQTEKNHNWEYGSCGLIGPTSNRKTQQTFRKSRKQIENFLGVHCSCFTGHNYRLWIWMIQRTLTVCCEMQQALQHMLYTVGFDDDVGQETTTYPSQPGWRLLHSTFTILNYTADTSSIMKNQIIIIHCCTMYMCIYSCKKKISNTAWTAM